MAQLEEESSLSPVERNTSPPLMQSNSQPQNIESSPSDSAAPHGNRYTPPTNGANGSAGQNPRSCITCRKRKVKCDKRHPCLNCNKAGIECLFPGPGRAPRRSRKPPDTELLARLRRLEGVVQSLGKGIDEDGETIIESQEVKHEQVENVEKNGVAQQTGADEKPSRKNCLLSGLHEPKKEDQATNGLVKEFGRLVVEDGRSRYVSNKFWTSLSEEVAEMRDILDDPTDDEDDYPSPGSGSSASIDHQGFIFNFSSISVNLRQLHPPESLIPTYWNIYITNVDPIIKLLHVPHHEKLISEESKDLDHVSKSMEGFLFTIYYAAVTSLSADDCYTYLGLEKQVALARYRFAVEQSLARANFLSTQELIVLQSLLLFLTCVRRSDDTRYVWTLTGLLIRLAQALGVHRDGQRFGLSPFDTEMRRRLWWQICTLDVRASEDQGTEPTIIEQSFDTKFPLNINDADLTTDMKEAPQEHEGATEMTFDLIRYSVSTTVRRLSYVPPSGPCVIRNKNLSVEDREKMISDLRDYLDQKYLRHLDNTVPLHWVASTVARLIMAKMWLIVHHPFSRADRGVGLPQVTKDRLFTTSLEVIEFSRLLETEKTTLKWGWLFRTYVQWHAIAFVLSQLCTRTLGVEVDRAWIVIEGVFETWGGAVTSNMRGMLWKPLRKLMAKARNERSKALHNKALFPLDGTLGPSAPSLGISAGPMSTVNGFMDFPTFDTSMPSASPLNMLTPESSNSLSSNGVQQIPFLTEQNQPIETANSDQLTFDPAFFAQQRPIEEDNINWPGWEEMVKDYQMESDDGGQGMPGLARDGMGYLSWMT